jgi:choline dehydrogenase-like flavoprotein
LVVDDVLPYFRRAETFAGGGDLYRGDAGPQRVAPARVKHHLTDAFIEGADRPGSPATRPTTDGARRVAATRRCRSRAGCWRTVRGYLRRAQRRSNLTVWTNSYVQKVVVESGRAIGAVLERRRRQHDRPLQPGGRAGGWRAGEMAEDVTTDAATYEHDVHTMKLAKTPIITILPYVVHPRSCGQVLLAGPTGSRRR